MIRIQKKLEKRTYSITEIECIILDSEITLQLQSDTPPAAPGETLLAPDFIKNDPFRTMSV